MGNISRALNEGKEVIVTGDMNLNHVDWNQTKKLRPLIDQLFTRILPHGVSQLVTKPARVSPHQPDSGLDHFFTNTPAKAMSILIKRLISILDEMAQLERSNSRELCPLAFLRYQKENG